MFKKFYPKEICHSTYHIDFQRLYRDGFRGIVFDIDNTLVPHGADADERAIELFKNLKEMGFRCCLLSNNNKKRVLRFNKDIHLPSIYNAAKPLKKGYLKAMEHIGTDVNNTIFVGDQLFTDIVGANGVGLYSIFVESIHPKEEIQIVFKRKLEKIVLHYYYKGNVSQE